MIIVGIDASISNTGFVLLDSNKIKYPIIAKAIPTKGMSLDWERQEYIVDVLSEYLSPYSSAINVHVFLEDYAFSSKGMVFKLGELGGIIKYIIRNKLKLPIYRVAPTTLKKFTTGKGNANKEQMMNSIFQTYGLSFVDDNIADAYALARYGLHALTKGGLDFMKIPPAKSLRQSYKLCSHN